MKPYGMTIILGFHLILGASLILNFVYSEQADKVYSDIVISFICIGIFAGLRERESFARKFTIIYYSIGIAVLLLQFIYGGTLSEEGIITNLVSIILSIAVISYLIKPSTKLLFPT